jgi:uncharacterized protein involved in exopolysaccharide biosynthesis
MTEVAREDDGQVALLAVATTLLRHRRRVLRWMFTGAAVAALLVFSRPQLYVASASFIPQGTDVSRSGLASLAGQFGVSLAAGTPSSSPDFYATLLKSRVLLRRVVLDTFVVQERGGERVSFLDLFKVQRKVPTRREEQGVRLLTGMVKTSVVRTTGIVGFSVATKWPSVSLAIASELVNGVNDFNQRTRQGQAAAERKFVEGRLAVAGADLRDAEDRLERFLKANRQYASSPELTFQLERLQRDVTLRQQVYTTLTQSFEEARIREVRDTPVITVIESPSVPTLPEPRGRLVSTLFGFLLGGLIGSVVVITSATMARRTREGDKNAHEFVGVLSEVKGEMLRGIRGLRERIRR